MNDFKIHSLNMNLWLPNIYLKYNRKFFQFRRKVVLIYGNTDVMVIRRDGVI